MPVKSENRFGPVGNVLTDLFILQYDYVLCVQC